MTTVHTPASIAEAVSELNGLGELLTAKEWHRAAIVATFVRVGKRGDNQHTEAPDSGNLLSAVGFARLGVRGLCSDMSVAYCVKCWFDATGEYPERGAKVELPNIDWPPPTKALTPGLRNGGKRATPGNIAEQMRADPELANAAAAALVADGVDQLGSDVTKNLARAANRKAWEDSAAAGTKATPPRLADRGKSSEQLTDETYWRKVGDALALIVDAQHRIAAGAEPPPGVALMMSIVVPAKDWDVELIELLSEQP